MPTFNSYPALQVQTADIPAAMQQGRENAQMNQLYQMKMGQMQANQGRANQLREIMPGVGAEAGLGPNAQKALALDPSQLAALLKIPKAKRDQMKEKAQQTADLLMPLMDPSMPEIQKPGYFAQARQRAEQMGMAMDDVPETYDPQWVAMMVAQAGQYKNILDQVPDTPSGYQYAEGGLAYTPGGPADPAVAGRLAEAKRGPDGGATPAQQANNAEIGAARQALDRMSLDRAEILRRTQKSTNTGRENPDYDPSLERLVRTATQRKVGNDPKFNLFHRRYLGPAPEFSDPAGPRALPPGVSAEQPGILDQIGDFFSGGPDTPAPSSGARRRGGARVRGQSGSTKKAIPQMSKAEIVALLDERGEDLTEDERKAILARLDALGL